MDSLVPGRPETKRLQSGLMYQFLSTVIAQLHHFADASETGHDTVSFLRLENADSKRHCSYFMENYRFAPLRLTIVQRLELTKPTRCY